MSNFIRWIRNFIFTGSYLHLWYLKATAIAILLLTILIYYRIDLKIILALSAILYLIGLLPQTYWGLIEPLRNISYIWSILKLIQKFMLTTRNGIFEGFIFMALGMYYAYNPIKLNLKLAYLGFSFSFAFLFLEYKLVSMLGWTREHDMYIFLVPTVFFMFYIAVNVTLKESVIYKHLRELSILIFYLHLLVNSILSLFFTFVGINIANSLLVYTYTVVATIFIAEIVLQLSHKYKCIKYFYQRFIINFSNVQYSFFNAVYSLLFMLITSFPNVFL